MGGGRVVRWWIRLNVLIIRSLSLVFCLSYRVGSVLIILNISDLEVVSTTKHSSSLVGLGVWTRNSKFS